MILLITLVYANDSNASLHHNLSRVREILLTVPGFLTENAVASNTAVSLAGVVTKLAGQRSILRAQ